LHRSASSEVDILAQMKPRAGTMSPSPGDTVSRSSRTHPARPCGFSMHLRRNAVRQGMEAKLPITFSNCCPWRAITSCLYFFCRIPEHTACHRIGHLFRPESDVFFWRITDIHRHVMAPYFSISRSCAKPNRWVTRVTTCGNRPANDPEHPWSNFTAFKAKFGGAEFHLVPTLDFVYDQRVYDQYTTMFARVPARIRYAREI